MELGSPGCSRSPPLGRGSRDAPWKWGAPASRPGPEGPAEEAKAALTPTAGNAHAASPGSPGTARQPSLGHGSQKTNRDCKRPLPPSSHSQGRVPEDLKARPRAPRPGRARRADLACDAHATLRLPRPSRPRAVFPLRAFPTGPPPARGRRRDPRRPGPATHKAPASNSGLFARGRAAVTPARSPEGCSPARTPQSSAPTPRTRQPRTPPPAPPCLPHSLPTIMLRSWPPPLRPPSPPRPAPPRRLPPGSGPRARRRGLGGAAGLRPRPRGLALPALHRPRLQLRGAHPPALPAALFPRARPSPVHGVSLAPRARPPWRHPAALLLGSLGRAARSPRRLPPPPGRSALQGAMFTARTSASASPAGEARRPRSRQGQGRGGPAAGLTGSPCRAAGPGGAGSWGAAAGKVSVLRGRGAVHMAVCARAAARGPPPPPPPAPGLYCAAPAARRAGLGLPPGGRRGARPHPPSLRAVRGAAARICSSIFSHRRTCTSQPHTWKRRTCRRAGAERRTKVPARIVPRAARGAGALPPARPRASPIRGTCFIACSQPNCRDFAKHSFLR